MKKSIFLPLVLMLIGFPAAGQTLTDTKFESAERLRRGYRFNEAIELFKEILIESSDSLIGHKINSLITKSENGLNMLQYASHPVVTGRASIPVSDFVLYYPDFKDRAWVKTPSKLTGSVENLALNLPNAILLKEGDKTILYSALNKEGNMDIYKIREVDGKVWSIPEPLNSFINSSGDELFPVLSQDKKQLFFSSTGHYGIGGFDLYVSYWDETTNDWGLPQNMGFPYSSVDDDILLIHSEDGLNTYLCSNRNSISKDSIDIYRLDFESTPVKRALTSIDEVLEIAALRVRISSESTQDSAKKEVMTSPETEEYKRMIVEVRQIQNEIDSTTGEISANRMLYNTVSGAEERAKLEKRISQGELSLLDMQSRLRVANLVVQQREMEFLSKGTIMPRNEEFFRDDNKRAVVNNNLEPFIVTPKSLGEFPELTILEPVEIFDYSFGIGEEAVMAEDHTIPDGLVYRIQIFSLTNQAELKSFKGLRPIFENKSQTGRWIYTVGQFYNFADASEILVKVKSAGFPSALIVAYENGKNITVRQARILEQTIDLNVTFQIKIEGYPAGMPQPVLEIIRGNTERDIAKKIVDGRELFLVGPFTNKLEMEKIVLLLKEIGAEGVTIEEIKKNETK
ncbi:MAG: hypothetical protein CVU13_05655 [Bacteroidetes bacterium HGW-Bacteroidetes-8]|nr:MAG: hypothetical protein CVU13_05655 [Bacteroidetes bacterium HGW-Bacteroidetes-8]